MRPFNPVDLILTPTSSLLYKDGSHSIVLDIFLSLLGLFPDHKDMSADTSVYLVALFCEGNCSYVV